MRKNSKIWPVILVPDLNLTYSCTQGLIQYLLKLVEQLCSFSIIADLKLLYCDVLM